jgi:hypothetical protein
MRRVLAIITLAGALGFDVPISQAREVFPWCAVVSSGPASVEWDCEYRSIEECRPNVLAGNRGFCYMNPAWPGSYTPKTIAPPKHLKRHVHLQ